MRAKCNLDCFNCPYEDCINDGELDSSIHSANWYERNKEKKKAYQREYNRKHREKKQADLEEKVCVVCGKKISIFDSRKKYYCVECQKIAQRQYAIEYQAAHREELNKYRREYIREVRKNAPCRKYIKCTITC